MREGIFALCSACLICLVWLLLAVFWSVGGNIVAFPSFSELLFQEIFLPAISAFLVHFQLVGTSNSEEGLAGSSLSTLCLIGGCLAFWRLSGLLLSKSPKLAFLPSFLPFPADLTFLLLLGDFTNFFRRE